MIDPAAFAPEAVSEEIKAQNVAITAKLAALPDPWTFPPAVTRERRRQGIGPFPPMRRAAEAEAIAIPGPAGPIPLRVIPASRPRGLYLHFHGGGWTWGGPDEQDPWLERIAACGLTVLSVGYRLAPEHPYPAAPDDGEAAALWLLREGRGRFGEGPLAIGGESAGAHLAVVTLLRLRDRHGLTPFAGANLFAGFYDLALTPSAARWGEERLVLNTRDLATFADLFCGSADRHDPDVSPIRANLAGLPPALLSVGTRDPLLDDTLFLAARWAAAGNRTELAVWPGGAHIFPRFESRMTDAALARIDVFLTGLLGR